MIIGLLSISSETQRNGSSLALLSLFNYLIFLSLLYMYILYAKHILGVVMDEKKKPDLCSISFSDVTEQMVPVTTSVVMEVKKT